MNRLEDKILVLFLLLLIACDSSKQELKPQRYIYNNEKSTFTIFSTPNLYVFSEGNLIINYESNHFNEILYIDDNTILFYEVLKPYNRIQLVALNYINSKSVVFPVKEIDCLYDGIFLNYSCVKIVDRKLNIELGCNKKTILNFDLINYKFSRLGSSIKGKCKEFNKEIIINNDDENDFVYNRDENFHIIYSTVLDSAFYFKRVKINIPD